MPGGAGGQFGTFDLGDIFGSTGSGGRLGDLLGGMFGGGGGRTTTTQQARPRRGADVETEASLTFSDAIDGATVSLRLTDEGSCKVCRGTGAKAGTMPKVCPTCGGTGQSSRDLGSFAFSEPCTTCRGRGLVVDDPCATCAGSGRAMSARTIQARIPAGVADGQRIKIKAKGAPGERGGPPGDLYVKVHVSGHPVFGRNAHNLTVTVPVTFAEAALGAEIKVPVHRKACRSTCASRPAPRTAARFRVRGQGCQAPRLDHGRPAREGRGPGACRTYRRRPRAALEKFRDATAGEDLREELLRKGRT